jgi:hypothetical protein
MAKKVYTLVKYEVKNGCDALNVLMVSTDKKKILKKYQREVAADKKVNPFWKKFKDRKLFNDFDDYYCVWDVEGSRMWNQTIIVIQCNNLVEKKDVRKDDSKK